MFVDEAYRRVAASSTINHGRFYSPGGEVGLGKGKLYETVAYPFFDLENRIFQTVEGMVYVLTHECDVDLDNQRIFNEDVLICPIIPLEHIVEAYREALSRMQLESFLTNLGARNISRVVYLPPYSGLDYGGVMYLNHITNTHISSFSQTTVTSVCAVTAFGLTQIEYALENHLLRPKTDRLAFSR